MSSYATRDFGFAPHNNGEVSEKCPVKPWATKEDWTSQQSLIQRLYLHEDKPLPEVMHIMESEHGFRATQKMYKQRIGRWGWHKRNKDKGEGAVARKAMSRPALTGTKSRSRGHTGSPESTSLEPIRKKPIADTMKEEAPFRSLHQDIAYTDIPNSPKDPQNLQITADVLKSTKDYINASFDAGTFVLLDDKSRLISRKPGGDQLVPLRDLFFQHRLACSLFDQGLNSEAGAMLNDASASLKRIVLAEHPRSLPTILSLVLYLRARKKWEIGDMLLQQFAGFVSVYNGPNHPFVRECQIFRNLDASEFDHLLALGCQYGGAIYKDYLGSSYDMGENSIQRAIAVLQDLISGRQVLMDAGPVRPEEWPHMLWESFQYQGRFDMAGRVALLIERSPRVRSPSPSMIQSRVGCLQ